MMEELFVVDRNVMDHELCLVYERALTGMPSRRSRIKRETDRSWDKVKLPVQVLHQIATAHDVKFKTYLHSVCDSIYTDQRDTTPSIKPSAMLR